MRMRRKRNLSARMENCAHLLISCPCELRGKWRKKYGYGKLYLEIGCGKGSFIVRQARDNPEILFIAMEKAENVIVAALEKAAQANIQNVRFINGLAENLADIFAQGEVSRIYINFCDPWPATRHVKRRLVGGMFLRIFNAVLIDGGEIHFKTDNAPLFDFALREFNLCGFTVSEAVNDFYKYRPAAGNTESMTEYEQKFYAEGVPIHRCVAKKHGNT